MPFEEWVLRTSSIVGSGFREAEVEVEVMGVDADVPFTAVRGAG